MAFDHVQPGGRLRSIRAGDYNGWQDAAKANRQRPEFGGDAAGGAMPQGGVMVMVRNDGETDIGQWGILGIEGVVFDEADNLTEFKARVLLSGIEPDIELHVGKFVLCIDPIKAGNVGRAVLGGAWPCQIDMVDTGHGRAEIADGDVAKLKSGATGSARILYVGSGTGTQWAVVCVDAAPQVGVFPVTMTQTGGSAGNKTTQCSFTYTVADLEGNELGAAVAPTTAPHKFARPSLGKTVEATAGLACYVEDAGSMVLSVRWCNEVPDRGACD